MSYGARVVEYRIGVKSMSCEVRVEKWDFLSYELLKREFTNSAQESSASAEGWGLPA